MEQSPLTITQSLGNIILELKGSLLEDQLDALQQEVTVGGRIIEDVARSTGKPVNIILNMTAFSGEYDVRAIDIMVDFARKNAPHVHKTAAFGSPERGAMAGEIIAALANRDNIQFFPSEEEALAWLAI